MRISMFCKSFVALVPTVLLCLVACSRDPNVVKKRYLGSGNKYFEKERYKEASIQYRNALKRDQRYGPAHYRLALTEFKQGQLANAASELRKAVELLPKDSPDHWDAVVKLSEIYLVAARDQKPLMDEVEGFVKELLARDANSFDG